MTTQNTQHPTNTTPGIFGSENGYPCYWKNVAKVECIPMGRKGYGAGQTECCAYCGRLTLNPKFYAYTLYGGTFDENPEDRGEVEPEGVVGFYPLGTDCARRLKKLVPVYDHNYKRVTTRGRK